MTDDLPPSAKHLLDLLDREGPMRQQCLIDRSWYSAATVKRALRTLDKRGLIAKDRDNNDLRQVVVQIDPEAEVEIP